MGTSVRDIHSLGGRLVIYGDINHDTMPYFNPAICFDGKQLKIAIRKCNFTTVRHSDWKFLDGGVYSKTDVLYGNLDTDTLEVTDLKKLELSDDAPIETKLAGLEDVRLFKRADGMHALGFESDRVTAYYHNASASMAEYLIKGGKLKYLRTLKKPDSKGVEKNWCPTDVPTKAFDFTYSPTQVWKDGQVFGEKYEGKIHGGSQLLLQDDGTYLSLVHQKEADRYYGQVYDKFVYLTYLARHDASGLITHVSEPFTFGTNENIEFASGMVEYKDDLIISLGIRDAKFAIARIKKSNLTDLFGKYKETV